MSLKIPKPGTYFLDVDGVYWSLETPSNQPAAIALQEDRNVDFYSGQLSTGSNATEFFYVPKGTHEIHYYYVGSAHKVAPLGSTQWTAVTANNAFAKIPVPEGADGKVWVFSGRVQQLWFLNVPNYILSLIHI